ncbi:MAG: radical SAM family heme chaperone HemW [Lachnospiraceae bacterium]|nr:radical SAM family heme chaperone HemW [Lachnospiraceae bacterium]
MKTERGAGVRDLSLYIHIPFCRRKCLYCDFLSAPASDGDMESYVNFLCHEIEKQSIFYRGHRVISVFLGGGTPSLLPADRIGEILRQIQNCFSVTEDAEITIECNPGTVTAEKLKNYITYGINRLSIGLQSTDDEELAQIGRIHDYDAFLETYRLAREAGFQNINIDLMAGLPGQSVDSYRKTLERVTTLEPEHISAYSLILEEGTRLYVNQSRYTFPTEEEDREMYLLTEKLLEAAGLHRYEISNYAREGRECRHNKVYWQRGDYVGFGLGASSMVADVRWKNPEDREAYSECVECVSGRTEFPQGLSFVEMLRETGRLEIQELTETEQMEEFMFLGLRLTVGIDPADFQRMFGTPLEAVYGETIVRLTEQGLLERAGKWLRLTARGIDVSNRVFAEFLF